MVYIKGERIKLIDPISIEHVTIFKLTGECLFDKKLPIDEYLDIPTFGGETLLVVVITKTKISQTFKIYYADA
ncbi:hypothetical protein SAMN06265379_11441 [Saccharicrinis carchari]|uniref:Uncharacterized protein n=1 Tax=Saccharicrinis carchari TaxID=1168039 RepID=A0A521F596_SACCC|nr:hypothetical protein [Saccharicrinis carchari]SMO91313.1 hypothetical protein SAMN06265379_11441 [Saccharicrinis carchari]